MMSPVSATNLIFSPCRGENHGENMVHTLRSDLVDGIKTSTMGEQQMIVLFQDNFNLLLSSFKEGLHMI